MSRSNPTDTTQNPSTRWISWNGEHGHFEYYNKEKKETVIIGDKLQFLLLDTMYSVRGWHKPSDSGIYSNEVRDTRSEPMVVKSFKGGILAEGLYSEIKDVVTNKGGKFTSNLYIGYKDGTELKLGSLTLSGAPLSVWMEFSKNHRNELNTHAVQFSGYEEKVNGRVTYRIPAKLVLMTVTDAANDAAVALDRDVLQPYLNAYLKKNKVLNEYLDTDQEPREDPEAEARRAQAAEWEASQEEDRRQRAGGDTKLRELAQRLPDPDDSDDIPF